MNPTHLTRNTRERCVMARVMRSGRRHHKSFSISKYGGAWESAEEHAREWLRDLLRRLPYPVATEARLSQRNKSGVAGVSLSSAVLRKVGGDTRDYHRWTARWAGCRLRGGVSWSCRRYGKEDAYVLAVLSRRLRSADRAEVIERWRAIKGGAVYREILVRWRLEADELSPAYPFIVTGGPT